ncbi:unnamed protein product [Caenorhabditis sp. 36 PRJEB53466]|nr:unnamed protein product [Caenorhabditis sp. 36 PRJEB53466]
MDVDAPADLAAQPAPIAEEEQSNWEMEKAEYERVQFNLNQELIDYRDRVDDLSRKNAQMADELTRHNNQVKGYIDDQKVLEAARNELTNKTLELEVTVSRLKMEKEEGEASAANATKEAQAAIVETFALKDQIQKLIEEKVANQHELAIHAKERRTIEYERERIATERGLHAEAKRWLMQEVSERDNKVSSLRLELSNKDMERANEKMHLDVQINRLTTQIEGLNGKIDMLQFNNTELLKKMEDTERTKASEIENLMAEIRCKTEYQEVLKHSMEESKNAADDYKDQLDIQRNVLEDARRMLMEQQEEIDSESLAHAEALKERDEELAQTRAELLKVNEMIKNMSDVKLNVSEEELAELAPAAAETVRLLRGGQSLSSLVLEHARVCGKLAETVEENTSLRTTLEELLETIDQKKPQLLSQRMVTDELFDRSSKLEKQLDDAESERKELVSQKDAAQRDLAYVRAEVEKYQRDYDFVCKRNAELMYTVERQSRMHDPNWSEQADEQLFQSIVQLQRRNVELESDIENAKTSAAQAAMNAQSEEMAQLRADLAVTKKSESALKTKVEQTKAAFDSLKEKTEQLKELVKDSVTATEARAAKLRAEEAVAAKLVAEAICERLRIEAETFKADHIRREQEFTQRLSNSESNSRALTETNIKLNTLFEAQKTNTATMEQAFQAAVKEKENALVDLGRHAMNATDEAAGLRVRVRALEDEIQLAKAGHHVLEMHYDYQCTALAKEEQMRGSVTELASLLKEVKAEAQSHASTQLDGLRTDRDCWKSSATRFRDELTHSKSESKLMQKRLEGELEVARSRLAEKEQKISKYELELNDLQSKLSSVQSTFSTSDTTAMPLNRLKREYMQLKTRTQFLESELDEAKRKLIEAEAAQKRMDAEYEISATHYDVLEENLKQSEQIGSMQKERLEAKAKCSEETAEKLTKQLAQNQLELNELKTNLEEQTFKSENELSELRRQLDVSSFNLNAVQRELDMANNNLLNMQNEKTRNAGVLEQHHSIVQQLEQRISDGESEKLRLQAELNNKSAALLAEMTAKNEADQMRYYFENFCKRRPRNEINSSCSKYEWLSTTHSAPDVSMDLNESAIGESSSGVIDSMQTLIQFLRQSKDEAMTRAMNAEVEMRRLRAETAEFERGKNALQQRIRDLETEQIATAASLVDRARLIDKVEALSSVQNLNSQLTEEKNKLQSQLAQIQKAKSDIEKQVTALSAKNNEQNLKISSTNQELIQRKREIEQLKQRADANARGSAAALKTQVETLSTQLTTARQEAATASEHAKIAQSAKLKAEEAQKAIVSKLTQTRQLAIKYRDENADLKKLLEAPSGTNDPAGPRIAALAKTHRDQVIALNAQIDGLKTEIESLNVKTMRMNMLETRLKKTTDQFTELKEQNDKLSEINRQLTQSKSVSATDVESKTSTPTTAKPPAILRQPPSLASDPSAGVPAVSKQPLEPDQTGAQKLQAPPGILPFGAKQSVFGKQFGSQSSSSSLIPPAPAPTNLMQPKTSPQKNPIPPSIPNEPMDIIPPVPSDNIMVVPDPTPPANTFGSMLPVPHTFQASARVPTQSLFTSSSTTTVQPIPEKKNVLPNIDSAPTTPGSNVTVSQATSSLAPGQQLFGLANVPPAGDNLALPEESVVEGAAGQSSLVSGSVDQQKALDADLVANDGESRDGLNIGGVSSSDGRRKRAANDFDTSEAKRQRDSPNEAVTSSETRQQNNLAEIPELDDDDGVLGLERDVSDEDANDNTIQERRDDNIIDLENDEEVLEDEMEGEEEDDDSFGNDDEFEDRKIPGVDDDDVVVLSDDEDDNPEDDNDNDAESLDDVDDEEDDIEEIDVNVNNDDLEEVLGGEDSQPSLDDQDREAASAVEEAEDEGRDPLGTIDEPSAPADPTGAAGIGSSARVAQDAQRVRLPTGLRDAEREDQCSSRSSSNETHEERPSNARNAALQRPTRGVYTPGQLRGRGRGRGGRGRGGSAA